ncbi:hypothetical protein L6164_013496 [Bauhinia variegata]|uniref:Uncharacterized protein n=1 Tax=Bauhinia variegata TaxID=167791 RepID=A0ACB9NHZ2_BAUVA|nr:hypothetical protein L6164_013496 [Bauhinia variegata]
MASMRIYNPNQVTLQALSGSGIELVVGVPNEILQTLANSADATAWVQTNILNFPDVKLKYIAVRNEIKPNDAAALFVLQAMQNINAAIVSANLQSQNQGFNSNRIVIVGHSLPSICRSDPNSLAYATFTSSSVAERDGPIGYQNLFDAMLGTL